MLNSNIDFSKLAESLRDSENLLANVDSSNSAPNRTANSAEETVRLLQTMIEKTELESVAQHKRFVAEVWLSVASIVVASVAAFASVYALYLTLTSL